MQKWTVPLYQGDHSRPEYFNLVFFYASQYTSRRDSRSPISKKNCFREKQT